jgi:hypothetical protein
MQKGDELLKLSCPGLTGASSTPRRLLGAPDPNESALEYWIARSSRAMTACLLSPRNQKRAEARCFVKSSRITGCPGGAETPPGLENYFVAFFAFLTFFAFFAFFAFLAIASSFGLMGGNATRGMLGGGPTSQHPRSQSQQIRRPLPRAVTLASSRYPQLLCVLDAFSAPRCASRRRNFASASRRRAARNGLSGLIPRQRSQSIARR